MNKWLSLPRKICEAAVYSFFAAKLKKQEEVCISQHPIMKDAVPALGGRPLFSLTQTSTRLTAIAAEANVPTSNGNKVTLLYIGLLNALLFMFGRWRTRVLNLIQLRFFTSIHAAHQTSLHHAFGMTSISFNKTYAVFLLLIAYESFLFAVTRKLIRPARYHLSFLQEVKLYTVFLLPQRKLSCSR